MIHLLFSYLIIRSVRMTNKSTVLLIVNEYEYITRDTIL